MRATVVAVRLFLVASVQATSIPTPAIAGRNLTQTRQAGRAAWP